MTRRLSVCDMTEEEIRAELGSKGILVAAPASAAKLPAVVQPIVLVPMKAKPEKKKRYKNAVSPGSMNPVAIGGEVQGETEKAYKFFDGLIAVWLPKSQCQYDKQQKVMILPEWLGFEKKLV